MGHDHHHHTHDLARPAVQQGGGTANCIQVSAPRPAALRRLWAVLGIIAVFMVVEAVGGWLSHSLALLADAGHMLTDVGALGLTLLTAWIARRPADDTKSYGYQRWEILAALINGALLFAIAIAVVYEALERIRTPEPIRSGLFLAVACAGLLSNIVALRLLHGDHEHSLNTRSAYLHILGDLLGSVGAIAAALVVRYTGWTPIDPVLSIALSLLILVGAWRLVRESTDILLEAVPRHVSLPQVQQRMLAVSGVMAVHDLHVWTVTSGIIAMSGHVIVPDLTLHPRVLRDIRGELGRLGIGHVTVQIEVAEGCGDEAVVAGEGREGGTAGGLAS
ncbi:MAG TPA: cation diffusion facilitator family transporter [Gemmatimonadales bacterium]|nr:cation diffusion facilitator family transporter [Gemmatimonadales bacterium]